ncbi:hypothetical protein NUV25_32575, partial [Burkholderia pseudomultivorans]|uniref:hypothetical protein n=1 Tax=Burkholderia pseudomultivorans TaxID=1207504 RepID=UPI002874B367
MPLLSESADMLTAAALQMGRRFILRNQSCSTLLTRRPHKTSDDVAKRFGAQHRVTGVALARRDCTSRLAAMITGASNLNMSS